MRNASRRPGRNRSVALACAAAIAAAGLTQTGAVASPVHAAAAPSLSQVTVTPDNPHKGHGFKVSFKTKAGGTYEIFYSTGQSGDLLKSGKTGTGTITTKWVVEENTRGQKGGRRRRTTGQEGQAR